MKKLCFLTGLLIGLLLIPAAVYIAVTGGHVPIATSSDPLPFEEQLAYRAIHARMEKERPTSVLMPPTETNLLAGATVYREHCAVCHGLPGGAETAIAKGLYPPPPQLFESTSITDEAAGEIYWMIANGIRLTGMPGFQKTLTDDQLWQVSLLLKHSDKLPDAVKVVLAPK